MIPALQGLQCGRFLSGGRGRHITRKISNWELIVVLNGQLGMFCGNQSFLLRKGDVLLIPPMVKHGGTENYAKGLSFHWIHFLPKNKESEKMLIHADRKMRLSDIVRLNTLIQFYQDLKCDPVPDTEKTDAVAGLILHEVFRKKISAGQAQPNNSLSDELPPLAAKAKHILVTRYLEPLTTSGIAAELGCSANYLGHVFGRYFGHGIIEEMHEQRISHACDFLARTSLTISQILYEVGYNDPAQFRRQFFQRHSMTPGEYRSKVQREILNVD